MTTKPQPKTPRKKEKREKRPPKRISVSYLRNSGLYYLQRYPSSSNNFRRVMTRKIKRSCAHHNDQDFEHCLSMLETIVREFENSGLLDDTLYTQGMVTSLRRSGKSERAITARLKAKGVCGSMIKTMLETHASQRIDQSVNAETQAAMIFIRKKRIGPFRTKPVPEEEERSTYQKELAKMARAGFSYETCRIVLGESAGET